MTADEARLARAALFGVSHCTQTEWAEREFQHVSGHARDEILALMAQLDDVRAPEAREDSRQALREHLKRMDAMSDLELDLPRNRRHLVGLVLLALEAGVSVPPRLRATFEGLAVQ